MQHHKVPARGMLRQLFMRDSHIKEAAGRIRKVAEVFDRTLSKYDPSLVIDLRRALNIVAHNGSNQIAEVTWPPAINESDRKELTDVFQHIVRSNDSGEMKRAMVGAVADVLEHTVSSDIRRPHFILAAEIGLYFAATYIEGHPTMTFRQLVNLASGVLHAVKTSKYVERLVCDEQNAPILLSAKTQLVSILDLVVTQLEAAGSYSERLSGANAGCITLVAMKIVNRAIASVKDDPHENRYARAAIKEWARSYSDALARLEEQHRGSMACTVAATLSDWLSGLFMQMLPAIETHNISEEVADAIVKYFGGSKSSGAPAVAASARPQPPNAALVFKIQELHAKIAEECKGPGWTSLLSYFNASPHCRSLQRSLMELQSENMQHAHQ